VGQGLFHPSSKLKRPDYVKRWLPVGQARGGRWVDHSVCPPKRGEGGKVGVKLRRP